MVLPSPPYVVHNNAAKVGYVDNGRSAPFAATHQVGQLLPPKGATIHTGKEILSTCVTKSFHRAGVNGSPLFTSSFQAAYVTPQTITTNSKPSPIVPHCKNESIIFFICKN